MVTAFHRATVKRTGMTDRSRLGCLLSVSLVIGWLRSIVDGSFTRAQSVTMVRSTDFPCAIPLLVLVEVTPADHEVDVSTTPGERVNRDCVDLAFGRVPADREVDRGDVVLHRPQVGTRGGELLEEVVSGTRRESAVGVDSVVVIEVLQLREIAPVNGAAVGMDELAELELVDHFLQYGVRRCHRVLSLSCRPLHRYRLICRHWEAR